MKCYTTLEISYKIHTFREKGRKGEREKRRKGEKEKVRLGEVEKGKLIR